MEINDKIKTLCKIASAFNENKVKWALGGSLLLYFHGVVEDFNDIDILIDAKDAKISEKLMNELGTRLATPISEIFKSPVFMKYDLNGLQVDIIADFSIVHNEKNHVFPLKAEDIKSTIEVNGETIYLHSLSEWKKYYSLMNKEWTSKKIESHLKK